MGKWCHHASLFLGNKDMFKNYKRFDFWHVQTADIGGTKPWKNNCSLIWKLFKFLMTLLAGLFEMRGCWHIGLRWAIVALWATCYLFGPRFDLYQSLNRLPIWNSQNCSMFSLAFVAGWLQGHWWGFISRNYVVWPTFLFMNIFIALKGSHFWFLFQITELQSGLHCILFSALPKFERT